MPGGSGAPLAEREPLLVRLAELAFVTVIYFLVAKGSLAFASINPSANPIWPPTGLAIGIVLIRGYRVLPAIFVGAFAANAVTTGGWALPLAIAAGNTGEAFVGAWLIDKWFGGVGAFQTPSGIARATCAFVLSTVISATVGVAALRIAGAVTWAASAAVWMTWWLGDVAGAVMVAPAIVLWANRRRLGSTIDGSEALAMHASAVIVGLLAFGPLLPTAPGRNGVAFVATVPLMWAALRGGPRNTSTVALILSAFAVWGVATGHGPFIQSTLNASFLLLVSFIVSMTLPSLALSAAVTSRDQALAEADLAVRAGRVGIWDWNLLTNDVVYSEQAKLIFGFPPGAPVTYEQVRKATHPDDFATVSALVLRAHDPMIRDKTPYEYRITRADHSERWVAASGSTIFDGAKAVRYLGTVQDVTEQKRLLHALKDSNTKVKLAMAAGQTLPTWACFTARTMSKRRRTAFSTNPD